MAYGLFPSLLLGPCDVQPNGSLVSARALRSRSCAVSYGACSIDASRSANLYELRRYARTVPAMAHCAPALTLSAN